MKRNKGITLISLVITIIILLILAGVVINFVIGQMNLIKESKTAEEKYNEQAAREMVELEMTDFKVKWFGERKEYPHLKELREYYVPSQEVDYLVFLYDKVAAIKDNYMIDIEHSNKGKDEILPQYALIKMKPYAFEFTIDDDLNIVEVEKNRENTPNVPQIPDDDKPLDEVPEGWIGIYTVEDLKKVANNLNANYIVMKDLDLSSEENWIPIGNKENPFNGIFDGNGYTIKNMKINTTNGYAGLFGCTETNSHIYYFTIENYTIEGRGNYIGAVVRI